MGEDAASLRQQLGRRLGVEPYYRIDQDGPERLVLLAQPELNRSAGRTLLLIGAAFLGLALVLLIGGAVAAGQGVGFGPVAITVALGGLLGGIGMQRIVGGRAVLSTRNQIELTPAGVTYRQSSAGFPERSQHVPIDRITGARLRRRPLAVGTIARRVQPIVVLELLVGPEVWIVDSAADVAALRPTVEALCRVLGIGLAAQNSEVASS
jgi:hypothetical protein